MEITDAQYRRLAAFRRLLREFLEFSASKAGEQGLQPQQHQLMLAIRGLPAGREPSVGELSAAMLLAPHTVSELTDRLETGGLVKRTRSTRDRRVALVELTAKGRGVLARLSSAHLAELLEYGPRLASSLSALTSEEESVGNRSGSGRRRHAR